MDIYSIKGKVNSIQTLGTLDGPGVRFIVFTQGCNMRCGCCHNPETWDISGGKEYTALEIAQNAEKYRAYFGVKGGITLSGGEPLIQSDFVKAVFTLCKQKGINTCLDTGGVIITGSVISALSVCDYVMLDIKYTNETDYIKYVGCSLSIPLDFLSQLQKMNIKTRIRQVIVPGINDTEENIYALYEILKNYNCVSLVELLPFKTICQAKYDELGIDFAFKNIPAANGEKVKELQNLINSLLEK